MRSTGHRKLKAVGFWISWALGACLLGACAPKTQVPSTVSPAEPSAGPYVPQLRVWLDDQQAHPSDQQPDIVSRWDSPSPYWLNGPAAQDVHQVVDRPLGMRPTLRYEILEGSKVQTPQRTMILVFEREDNGWKNPPLYLVSRGTVRPGITQDLGRMDGEFLVLDPAHHKVQGMKFKPKHRYVLYLRVQAAETLDRNDEVVSVEFEVGAPKLSWGELRWIWTSTNIRARPSTSSAIVGMLGPGDAVRADFPQGEWYAVFPTDDLERSEALAIGYVMGSLLKKDPP